MNNYIPGLEELLNGYAESIIRSYKDKLKDVRTSGLLSDSITYKTETSHGNYEITIHLEEYWKYIEYGRAPGKKFPPLCAILDWIQIKRLIPEPYTLPGGQTRIPTDNQLAFLIGRRIATEGIEAKPFLQESIDENFEAFSDQLIDLLGDTVLELIHNSIN